jgi:hypothetical protein
MAIDPRILRQLGSVRRRVRVQAALDVAARAALVAAAGVLVAVYLWRLGVLTTRGLGACAAGAAAIVVVAAAAAAARRIPLARVAKRIDVTHGLHDRLGSALAFAREAEPTAFMRAAMDDAVAHAARVAPKRAAPIARPRGLGASALVLGCAGVVALLHFPERAHVLANEPPPPPRLAVDPELLEPERAAVEDLQREAERTDDRDTKDVAAEMARLLKQLDAEELTRKQVFEKLAELENRIKPSADGNFDELKEKLKKAGVELGREKLTREAGDALQKEDLQKAKQELEKLAAEAERLAAEDKKDKKDQKDQKDADKKRDELARSLDRAAQPQEKSAAEKKREQEEKRLRDEQRRLQREMAQRPNDQDLKRRLERNQRELQRLEREKQQQAERQRQLQRLQRELSQAAEQLRNKLSPEAAEALRRAAQQMGQMENEIRKLGNMQKVQVQIAELKEVLRRAGQSKNGKGQQGNNSQGGVTLADGSGQQGDGKDGEGKDGNGKNGKGGQKSLLRDFNDRAGGGEKTLILGAGGKNPVMLPLPLGPGDKPGPSGEHGGDKQGLGEGIGDQHDPNLAGDPTHLASKRTATRVEGKDGPGPSRSETILGSSERGFASRAYKRVYGDYSSVVEEVMSKERVPPGYRYYVKRYFQLIKPRE